MKCTLSLTRLFQSTLPHGERLDLLARHALRQNEFQSTLPHGERREDITTEALTSQFQSTLPHGERQSR